MLYCGTRRLLRQARTNQSSGEVDNLKELDLKVEIEGLGERNRIERTWHRDHAFRASYALHLVYMRTYGTVVCARAMMHKGTSNHVRRAKIMHASEIRLTAMYKAYAVLAAAALASSAAATAGLTFLPSFHRTRGGGARLRRPSRERTRTTERKIRFLSTQYAYVLTHRASGWRMTRSMRF